MNTHDKIANYDGGKWRIRGEFRRAHRATITLKGVEIDVDYTVEGSYLPATDTDPAEYPTCFVQSAAIGGVECLRLLNEEDIAARVEQQWGEP